MDLHRTGTCAVISCVCSGPVRILIAEDDPSLARALTDVLRHHGHACWQVARGDDALRQHRDADLLLLDLQLLDTDGFSVLQRLRTVSTVPVVVVTARGDERSTVRALHLGADDYLVKPVRMNELVARVQAVARRRPPADPGEPPGAHGGVVRAGDDGDVVVDLEARSVQVAGRPVALTAKEFDLLAVLARRPGEAVRRQQVLDELWGDAFVGTSRSLDVHLASLRSKLGRPDLITTIRGFGYRLRAVRS